MPIRIVGILLLVAGGVSADDAPAVPFVAGFERFARHDEIPRATAGRLLLTELSCTACHRDDGENGVSAPKRGPRLNGVGDRLRGAWVRRYLADPHGVKPGTTMPDVLAGLSATDRERALDVLPAFLASQHERFRELRAGGLTPLPHEYWSKGDVERGRALYHHVGCVACHEPEEAFDGGTAKPSALDQLLASLDPEEIEELGLTAAARPVASVPHGDLVAKWTRRSLTDFLLDPTATRPAGRMPSLKLTPMEAAHVAAYLLREQPRDVTRATSPGADDPQRVAEGRHWFATLGCVNCHTVRESPDLEPLRAKPLRDLDPGRAPGCLGEPSPGRPHVRLDELQRAAIEAALQSPRRDEPKAGDLDFTLLQANCFGCHERDGRGGVGRRRSRYFEVVGHVDIGDEGRLPPPLDHVGRKLTTEWLAKVFAGEGDVRPFMRARMPRFPKGLVESLPKDFAKADAADRTPEDEVFGDVDDLVEAGRQLLDTGCVQCHPLRDERVPGTVGVDLVGITERVHPAWFRDFLRDPGALKPRTRMPTFFPNGRSVNRDVLDGEVDLQIAVMWAYLKRAKTARLPDKIAEARARSFELKPTEQPIVLRTFLEKVGTHAIAVGYPAGVHVAFDAEAVRFDRAWRGRFLDAYGTWFVRFAPPAKPLGTEVVTFPPGVPLAVVAEDAAWPTAPTGEHGYRFGGFRLDPAGVPTFLYRFGDYEVEDRLAPHGERGLRRRLLVRLRAGATEGQPDDRLVFRALAGKGLKARDHGAALPGGLGASVSAEAGRGAVVREHEWRVPVVVGTPLQVEYSW